VSTRTEEEWISFINNKPYGISLSDCDYTIQALWHFDEGSGDFIEDSSPNDIHLDRTLYAQAPSWINRDDYTALYFNPARLKASHSSAFKFLNSDKYQIDVVFKLTGSVPSINKVFCGTYGTYEGKKDWWVGTEESTGKLDFTFRDGTDLESINGNTNVYDGKWHKASFIYNNRAVKIYLDGSLDGSATSSLTGDTTCCTTLSIGWYNTGEAWDYYAPRNFYLDEIRILKGT